MQCVRDGTGLGETGSRLDGRGGVSCGGYRRFRVRVCGTRPESRLGAGTGEGTWVLRGGDGPR